MLVAVIRKGKMLEFGGGEINIFSAFTKDFCIFSQPILAR